jgi:hypothetical protein
MNRLDVTWLDAKREPQNPSDPKYPDGIDADLTSGAVKWCSTALPYPAKRCGSYLVECRICRMIVVVSTAGRSDDPRSVKIACRQDWN